MNTLTFKRNYKYILFFLFLIVLSVIFSSTRIISYNFGRYTTELEIKKENIENEINIFDEQKLHNITLDLSQEDYNKLISYYIKNEEKQYIQIDITIDGVMIENVGIKLKGSKILSSNISGLDSNNIDFSFLIKFDEYNPKQSYLGFTELALIAGDRKELQGEYIAGKIFEHFGVASPESAFAYVTASDFLTTTYLVKQVVNEEFLTQNYGDNKGLLYKAHNSMSFTYLGEDPTTYIDLFSQETLKNNYDLKKLIEILQFVSESSEEDFKYQFYKYINIENYVKFLAINNYLYSENKKIGLLNSYYIYFDLETETIKFIPWDSEYIYNFEETSLYDILEKIYSKQEIIKLSKKDVREILDNFSDTTTKYLKEKYTNDLESHFLDKDTFKDQYEDLEESIINEIESSSFIENLEREVEKVLG